MSRPTSILMTCVGGTLSRFVLHWLEHRARLPLRIYGADAGNAPFALSHLCRFHRVPDGAAPNYVDTMFQIAERDEIDIIVPCSDEEAFALAFARDRFRAIGCDILASSPAVMAVIRDKLATYRALAAAGLTVPEHSVIDTIAQMEQAIDDHGYPLRTVIIKPATGRGGRGLFVLLGRDSPPPWLGLGRRERRLDERAFSSCDHSSLISGTSMVMPSLYAPVYDADVLACDGKAKAVVVRRRHNPVGIPWTGNTICRNDVIESYVRAATEVLGLDAVHDMDLMSDAEGRPALLEVNPRMSGSIAATLAAGIPFLDAALASRSGVDLPVPLPDRDVDIVDLPEI